MIINNIFKRGINYSEIIIMISLWFIGTGANNNMSLSISFLVLCIIISFFNSLMESKISIIFGGSMINTQLRNISMENLYFAKNHINQIIDKVESRNVRN